MAVVMSHWPHDWNSCCNVPLIVLKAFLFLCVCTRILKGKIILIVLGLLIDAFTSGQVTIHNSRRTSF